MDAFILSQNFNKIYLKKKHIKYLNLPIDHLFWVEVFLISKENDNKN